MNKFQPFYLDNRINLIPSGTWDQHKLIPTILQSKLSAILGYDYIEIERPKDSNHGDYSTNIALKVAKQLQSNPRSLAEELVNKITSSNELNEIVSKVEIAGPGFINFFIDLQYIWKSYFESTLDINQVGKNNILSGKTIMMEYAHPNPFKAFHIGHLRNIILGESLIRILETHGANVLRVNYQGDVGMHIAKSIWGLLQIIQEENINLEIFENSTHKLKVQLLGRAYAKGAGAYKEDPEAEKEIKDINHTVYAIAQDIEIEKYNWTPSIRYSDFIKSDKYSFEKIASLWKLGVRWSLEYLESNIYKRLYTTFLRQYMESETQYLSEKNINLAIEQGILEKSDGAIVFKGEKYGLDTRVFLNSLQLPTYEGKELGLAELEFTDYGNIDLCIHNVAVEQISFFKVTFKVQELLNSQLYKGKQYHSAYEFVGLKKGKMSSRTGNVVLAEDVLDEAHNKIREIVEQRESTNFTSENIEDIAIGSIKYSFLNISPYSYLAFDLDKSVNFEGDSGPYIQYVFARANKILADYGKEITFDPHQKYNFSEIEAKLLLKLTQFGDAVIEAGKNLSPNNITSYLHELSQIFNSFYKNNKILKEPDLAEQSKRLLLTKSTATIVQKGLDLLGIKVVAQM
jgi:arginyl-tRNA synthetase